MMQPGLEMLKRPVVHPRLAALITLPMAHKQRPTTRINIGPCERQRLTDPQPRPPQHDDQRPHPQPVRAVPGTAHHPDDLLHSRRIGRILHPLVPWRAAGQVAG